MGAGKGDSSAKGRANRLRGSRKKEGLLVEIREGREGRRAPKYWALAVLAGVWGLWNEVKRENIRTSRVSPRA